jgi:3-oxoadipate enol-lactonase
VVERELPPDVRGTPAAANYVAQRTRQLSRHPLSPHVATLWQEPAVPSESALVAFPGRALVIGCRGDALHPAAWAEHLARLLPDADLHVYDDPAVIWHQRSDLRHRISSFLNA